MCISMDQDAILREWSAGRLCAGAAARLLDLPRSEFLQLLAQHGYVRLSCDEEALQQEFEAIYQRLQDSSPEPASKTII
jgi:hypothetical protein